MEPVGAEALLHRFAELLGCQHLIQLANERFSWDQEQNQRQQASERPQVLAVRVREQQDLCCSTDDEHDSTTSQKPEEMEHHRWDHPPLVLMVAQVCGG